MSRAVKLLRLLRRGRSARALARHRVAAAVEHLGALRFCTPASVIDVGANKGQFSLAVRLVLPREVPIHAFEPLPEAADRYARVFAGDRNATLHRVAIGAEAATARFFVTGRADSSSLLEPTDAGATAYRVEREREIEVEVRPLTAVLDVTTLPRPRMLKIDVQGAELGVLQGTPLADIDQIYVELSFVELYRGQALFEEVRALLADRGFQFRGPFNLSETRLGPTQADCLFVRD